MRSRRKRTAYGLLAVALLGMVLCGCPTDTPFEAEFTAVPQTGQAPLEVRFTDATATEGAVVTAWSWDFGDGQTSALQNPIHLYTQSGMFTVSLTVSNADGASTTVKPGHIVVLGLFQVRCKNVGDYPMTDVFIVKANATNWGYNHLTAPLAPGDEVILAREFTQGQHMVGVVFSVDGRFEDVILRGNLNTVGMPDAYVTLSAFRSESGEIGVGYQWGLD